uniref:Uncharacterized protein n=1 Tax=Anopheles coluzzii TaxID=1518534 RepID=A0A8W7PKL4_ANOCL
MTQKDTDDGAVAAGPWLIRRRSGYQMTEIRSTTGAARPSIALPNPKPAKPFPLPVTAIAETRLFRPWLPFMFTTAFSSKHLVSKPMNSSSPTASGGPILRPGIFDPDHPRSSGLSFRRLKFTISSRMRRNFASRSLSSGSFCCWTSSRPRITGADSPGHTMFALP